MTTTAQMIVKKLGNKYFKEGTESEIISLNFSYENDYVLNITIETWKNSTQTVRLEIEFDDYTGFRCLEEVDTGYISMPEFSDGHHIFKIEGGGWRSDENTQNGFLAMSFSDDDISEYFILTSNTCLSVLSRKVPIINEIEG